MKITRRQLKQIIKETIETLPVADDNKRLNNLIDLIYKNVESWDPTSGNENKVTIYVNLLVSEGLTKKFSYDEFRNLFLEKHPDVKKKAEDFYNADGNIFGYRGGINATDLGSYITSVFAGAGQLTTPARYSLAALAGNDGRELERVAKIFNSWATAGI